MEVALKIAVPNKGALSEKAIMILREAGYRQRADSRDLVLYDRENSVEFYYLRPRDIAVYVGEGALDLGITGRDMLLDADSSAQEILTLGFGRSTFRFAAPAGAKMTVEQLDGLRVATSYPGLLSRYLSEQGVNARLIHLDGAVESSIRLGVADVIADVVETGTTLRKAGLELFGDVMLESEAIVVCRPGPPIHSAAFDHLMQRLSGVLVARNYVVIDYDVPVDKLDEATRLTPGLESPTISPLAKPGWVAVRALIPSLNAQLLMDDLWDLGARGILLTDLAACRL